MVTNIIKLGWKNVWRSPTRSGVVMVAVLLGTWAGIFTAGFFNGMVQDALNNQIELSVGHIQISHPQFEDLYNPKYSIANAEEVIQRLNQKSYVEAVSAKSVATGLAQSPRSSFGVTINGADLQSNPTLAVKKYITDGSLPDSSHRNGILIGNQLADRLGLSLQSRMVLSFQDVSGDITGGAFRVTGIFDTFSDNYDKGTVFVSKDDLTRLLGNENAIHNIRIDTDDLVMAETYANQLKGEFPHLEIKNWREIAPELRYIYDMTDFMLYIVMIIILIGLFFSIINTMLMAILERTRELGMLRAIGMNKARTFSMVIWETMFLTMVGSPAGLLLGWLFINYFGSTGIDLSVFAEGLNAYGFSTIIYPTLAWQYYLNIMLMIAAAALLSALYPAWKTLKLNPVEAIRKFN